MTPISIEDFQQTVWGYYAEFGRDLSWRHIPDSSNLFAYYVLVSELMLQQTQVKRVILKYNEWIDKYPDISDVASASLADILESWSGLGYNRRAKYLHTACKLIMTDYGGIVPDKMGTLQKLPGVGINTAGAILAYAYNQPVVFIETNIRSVFIHHFFAERDEVSDSELLPFITEAIDKSNPREWYWALMDYGTYLKTEFGNAAKYSKQYKKQSSFEGSKRQIRGVIIKQLISGPKTIDELALYCDNDNRLENVLAALEYENLIAKTGVEYRLS